MVYTNDGLAGSMLVWQVRASLLEGCGVLTALAMDCLVSGTGTGKSGGTLKLVIPDFSVLQPLLEANVV